METRKFYNCKNEEIIVICGYLQANLQRDLADFTDYSPKFNEQYFLDLKSKNEAMNRIIFPNNKTKELKIVTARLYANMDSLFDMLNRIEGYIRLSKSAVPLSVKDFGIKILRQKIRSRDAEGALKALLQINSNIEKYGQSLTEQGLSPEIIEQFSTAFAEIDSDNQKQYELISARRILSAENINTLNVLHVKMMEICKIGKILYGKTQKEKIPDYTFSYLIKKVRTVNRKLTDEAVMQTKENLKLVREDMQLAK
jgi:hypothetical protein